MTRAVFSHTIKRRRIVGFVTSFLPLGVFCFSVSALGATEASPKRVLIFSSFGRDMAPSNATAVSFRTALVRELAEPVDLDDATVDAARFGEPKQETTFVNLLQQRFAGRKLDLVVALSVPATSFVTRYRERLFGTTPLLITAIDQRRLRPEFLTKDTAVLPYRVDLPGFVAGILRVLPNTKNIAVVVGASPLEKFWLSELRREFRPFNDRVSFTWLNDLSFEEMKKRAAALPARSAILYPFLMLDAAGVPYTDEVALKSLSEVANAPIFVFFESQFGQGVVGGGLLPNRTVGVEAARLAVRLLRGEIPSSIPTKAFGTATPVYNWHELRRWGISEARLPPGSIVQFREPTYWEQHKWLVIFALALCLAEGVFIDVLLRERRRRRMAQERLDERLRFERLLSELSNVFINLPTDRVETEIQHALGRVAQALQFDIAALSVFTGHGTEGRVAYTWRAKGVPEIPSDLTDQDFPWVAQELLAGHDVSLGTLEQLPPKAHIDRATYEQYHVRSAHNVPMVAGGRVIGVLGLCTVWAERKMSGELLQCQRLLGEIFANALTRKQAEESLRESEQNFRGLAESTAAVPWRADVETWFFTYVGPQAVKLLGYPVEQWYEKDFWISHLHPDDKEFALNTCLTLSKSAGSFEFEYRMIDLSGKTVWVHDIVKCEQQDGKPAELRGFMIDISERKQNEAALRESEERMTLAMSAANLGLWTWDVVRDEVWVTPEGRRFFGWEKSDVINFERFIETLHPDDREATRRAISRSLDRGDDYTVEYRVVSRDGGIRWIATRGRVEFSEDRRPLRMLGVAVDMTARKHSEEVLRESEERFRTMADTAPVMIWMAGVNKLCTFFNKGWLDFTGRTLDQELGNGWAEGLHREDFDRSLEMYANSFDARREFTMEYRLRRHDGEYRWVLDNGVPRLGPDGTFLGYIGTAIDITRRKDAEAELQRNRQELAHVTRISTMGELAASLAHELNQPLTAILSNAQAAQRFLAAKPSDLQEVHEILKDIVQDNSRAGEVIQRMRVLVKKGELAFVPLDIGSVIRDVVALVRSDAILHSVRVVLEFNGGLPLARGDRVQLQQVVLNLLLNAFDAMKDLPASEREVSLRAELDSAGMLTVSVRDRGIGISGAKVDKIFEPFYTTKRDGLGMGLSISRSIIEAHGGQLWVENNQERGTTFHFTIPTEAKVER